jgi:ring-1,2-phenylacetyl-CoA epoxidase subunit PaaC
MQASIQTSADPSLRYVTRLGDTCLILAQRLSEWCGHGPALEEDIAMANIALDLIGQARALLAHAGSQYGTPVSEDQLAFLRDERDYLNPSIVELPRGDFAFTVLRNLMVSTFLRQMWEALSQSSDEELAAIAAKAVKEARYHQEHSGDWVIRLAQGTPESRRRTEAALRQLWAYTPELFEADEVDRHAAAQGLGPAWSSLQARWQAEMQAVFAEAKLEVPALTTFRSTGKRGVHTEHMGFLLAQMQHLQRSFPGAVW